MACDPLYDDKGNIIGIVCSTPWGIGMYKTGLSEPYDYIYGFPPRGMNPHEFIPDVDSCSQKEIESWEEAKLIWDQLQREE